MNPSSTIFCALPLVRYLATPAESVYQLLFTKAPFAVVMPENPALIPMLTVLDIADRVGGSVAPPINSEPSSDTVDEEF